MEYSNSVTYLETTRAEGANITISSFSFGLSFCLNRQLIGSVSNLTIVRRKTS